MSRYAVPTRNEQYAMVAGWDPPLDTFFAQVFDHTHGHEDDGPVFEVGRRRGEVSTVESLVEALADYATLPVTLQEQLVADSQVPREPVAPEIAQLLDALERLMDLEQTETRSTEEEEYA
jgi:hypothetical protein